MSLRSMPQFMDVNIPAVNVSRPMGQVMLGDPVDWCDTFLDTANLAEDSTVASVFPNQRFRLVKKMDRFNGSGLDMWVDADADVLLLDNGWHRVGIRFSDTAIDGRVVRGTHYADKLLPLFRAMFTERINSHDYPLWPTTKADEAVQAGKQHAQKVWTVLHAYIRLMQTGTVVPVRAFLHAVSMASIGIVLHDEALLTPDTVFLDRATVPVIAWETAPWLLNGWDYATAAALLMRHPRRRLPFDEDPEPKSTGMRWTYEEVLTFTKWDRRNNIKRTGLTRDVLFDWYAFRRNQSHYLFGGTTPDTVKELRALHKVGVRHPYDYALTMMTLAQEPEATRLGVQPNSNRDHVASLIRYLQRWGRHVASFDRVLWLMAAGQTLNDISAGSPVYDDATARMFTGFRAGDTPLIAAWMRHQATTSIPTTPASTPASTVDTDAPASDALETGALTGSLDASRPAIVDGPLAATSNLASGLIAASDGVTVMEFLSKTVRRQHAFEDHLSDPMADNPDSLTV